MKFAPRILGAAILLLSVIPAAAQIIEFGNVTVVQNDAGNVATSVTLTKAAGSSSNFNITGGNRGDYDVTFGTANDVTGGVMLTAPAQNGRNNLAQGDTFGLFYATTATDWVGGTAGRYWIPVFRAAQGDEANINVACGWFSYSHWLGAFVRNSTGGNGGANNTLAGSPGISLGTHFIDVGGGVSTVNLTALGGSSASGILLVNHAKNEDNYAASRANADGTFTVWVKDNGSNSSAYEQDPVAFVYIPTSAVGTKKLVAMGRVNSGATTDISGGSFTLAKGGTGQWYLTIAGQNNTTGTLLISPEGGGTNTLDNIVSYQWDSANSRWVIESRDLTDASTLPSLQDGGSTGEDMFSFAFFTSSDVPPSVSITAPVVSSYTTPASFTVEATAVDSDGTVAQVELYRNGVLVGTDTTSPYSFNESTLPAGVYSYVARAVDNNGGVTDSTAKVITVAFDPNNPPANTALRFDGVNDYVTMGAAPELRAGGPPTNALTLECWFKREGVGITASSGSGGVSVSPLISHGRGENDNATLNCNYLFGITASGVLAADFEEGPTGTSVGLNHPITGTTVVTNNVWHHAAVTYDGTTWRLYLNGNLEGTTTVGQPPAYDTIQHFAIGSALNSSGAPEGAFAGTIDEVRVWNYARSASEIGAGKDIELSSASGLIGRYGLNEGYGLTASSTTGSSAGTLTSGPAWVEGAPFATANTPPSVTLAEPQDGTHTFYPLPVTFSADVSDSDGSVSKVEFLVNGVKVGEDADSDPYVYDWTPPAVGTYSLTALVYDNLGARRLSTAASLIVETNPNQAPVVTAVAPAAGAEINTTSTVLQANLADPEGDGMTVTFYGRQDTPTTPGEDFTLVAIPDTQYYSEGSSSRANTVTVAQLVGTFGAQTEWVVNNRLDRNIAFVSHMGDIVENGNFNGNTIQWERASAAMGKLEDPVTTLLAQGIPFGLAPGNHDIDPIGAYDTGSTLYYNQYFGTSRFAGRNYWGGNYGTDNTNNYQLFSASGLDFIVIHFAYDTTPNAAILNWADALLKAHPNRRAIVTSHYIIGQGNPASFGAQGSGIYNALKDNPNFFLMLCGHIHAEGRRSDVFEGRTVYSVLSDYQGLPNGGNGFLRTFTFSPANNRIRVQSWSPTLGRAAAASDGLPHFDGTFDLAYNMQSPLTDWVALGTVTVPPGGTLASYNWTGLERGKHYEWYAAATDGVNVASSAGSSFSTSIGQVPTVTLDAPVAGAVYSSPATIVLEATANDTDGDIERVEFFSGATKLGEDTTAPYTFTWTGVGAGNYTLSAQAIDNDGLSGTSGATAVTVNLGDHLPVVSLSSTPAPGSIIDAPADVVLTATATDNEGPVAKVEFFSGTTTPVLLGEDTSAPFTLNLDDQPAGLYTFTARATDSVNQTTTSASISLTIVTEADVPATTSTVSVGTFDPPTWTVTKTGPAPYQFNLPGTDAGDLELKINGVSATFNSGITLAANWNSPATIAAGITSDDNICQPYVNASGKVFVSVLDNSNNNAADANPSTTEQTGGVSVTFLPYAAGWTGASVNSSGGIIAGNLPTGVTVSKTGTGIYAINGLSVAGNLIAVTNGDSGTLADNVCSVFISGNRWQVDTRDNAGGGQDNEFSFVYIPPATTGVYAGKVSGSGVVSSLNDSAAALGVTATSSASGIDIQIGDGTLINPTTATIFLVGDATSDSAASDNLISWSASGNKFRVYTQDLPQIANTHQAIATRFLVIPYTAGVIAPNVTLTAPVTGAMTKSPVSVAFSIADAAPAGSLELSFGSNVLTLAASQKTLGSHAFTFDPTLPTAATQIASGSPIADGLYAVTLTYRDTAGNVLASASSSNVLIDTTGPVFTLPEPITVEATGPSGAEVSYAASATDTGSGLASSSFIPASGSTFAVGTTTVAALADDQLGNTSVGSFTVTVEDTTAPSITPPSNVVVAATSPQGAMVNYDAALVTDLVSTPVVSYSQNSGTVFPIGTTTVTITAEDEADNVSTATFTVTVTNGTPVVSLVGANPLVFEAAANYTDPGATALDGEDGPLMPVMTSNNVVANVPGSYAVTWTATDSANTVASATRAVQVVDTTAPNIVTPADIGAAATSASGATVTYSPANVTDVVGVAEVTYSHPSGSTFPIGTTTVTITAKDAANNASTATFTVSVLSLAITTPAQNAIVKEAAAGVKFEGTAAASATAVRIAINGNAPISATLSTIAGGKKWTVTTTAVNAGTNIVIATATAGSTTVSTAPRTFFYEALKPITVTVTPTNAGTITFSPVLATGSRGAVGKTYTVTAKPSTGYFFSHWSGKTSGTALTSTFVFAEGDSVVANFTASPFTDAVAGLYNGTIRGNGPAADTQANAGLFTATVTKNTGAFTGKFLIDGLASPVAGVFSNDTLQFSSSPVVNGFMTSLTLDTANSTITGTVTQRKRGLSVKVLDIAAPKAYSKTDLPPANLGGAYNVAFTVPTAPGTLLADEYPSGNGYGVLTVSSTDASAKFAGVLADGTAFSSASVLCKTNSVAIYSSFASSVGALVGVASLDPLPATTDVTGSGLRWFRRQNNSQYYPWGYDTGLTVDLLGAKQSTSTQNSLGLSTTPTVEVSGGPFTAVVSKVLGVSGAGFASADKTTKLSFSIAGLMSGEYAPSGLTSKHAIKGIIVGKPGGAGKAYGYFLTPVSAHTDGSGQGGKVEVKP